MSIQTRLKKLEDQTSARHPCFIVRQEIEDRSGAIAPDSLRIPDHFVAVAGTANWAGDGPSGSVRLEHHADETLDEFQYRLHAEAEGQIKDQLDSRNVPIILNWRDAALL